RSARGPVEEPITPSSARPIRASATVKVTVVWSSLALVTVRTEARTVSHPTLPDRVPPNGPSRCKPGWESANVSDHEKKPEPPRRGGEAGMTPEQRRRRARIVAHASWAKTSDRTARTSSGTKAFLDRFER